MATSLSDPIVAAVQPRNGYDTIQPAGIFGTIGRLCLEGKVSLSIQVAVDRRILCERVSFPNALSVSY